MEKLHEGSHDGGELFLPEMTTSYFAGGSRFA